MAKAMVHTINKAGEVVPVLRRAALITLLQRPFAVWNDGKPRIWRGTGNTLSDAEYVQRKYKGSYITEKGVRMPKRP